MVIPKEVVAAMRECMACMDSLRDYVCESGAIGMVGARNAVLESDAAYEHAIAVLRLHGESHTTEA